MHNNISRRPRSALQIVAAFAIIVAAVALPAAASAQTVSTADIAARDQLIANQEALLNVYRCRFNIDTQIVPGGCHDGAPARPAAQPGEFTGTPTQADIAARDSLINSQEALLNVYRCRFNIDTQIVPGGCHDGAPARPAEPAEELEPSTNAIRMIAAGGTDVVLQSLRVVPATSHRNGVAFEWTQLSGPTVELVEADSEYAGFTAPVVEEETTLVFSVDAEYPNGVTVSDTISIQVVPRKNERVLAALVDYLDVDHAERLYTRDEIVDLLVDNPDSLRGFISQTSRGLVNVDFDVLDWITINKNRSDYPLGDKWNVISDAVSALSGFADLSRYDKVMLFMVPLEQGYPGCTAYLDDVGFDTPHGNFELGVAVLSGYDMGCVRKGRIAHEFGHTFGFVHSYLISCDKEPPIPASTIDPTDRNDSCYLNLCTTDACTETAPSDAYVFANADFDMLGGDDTERYEDFFPVHFHATWQDLAGWLADYQVISPDTSGKYWITALESLTPTPKAIKILLGTDHMGAPQYYWLQTRAFSPCKVDVRLQASHIRPEVGYPGKFDTFFIENGSTGEDGTFDLEAPFHDRHRGIRLSIVRCELQRPGNPVRVEVSRTKLDVSPRIVATLEAGEAEILLTNRSSANVDVGNASIGGRHPGAFAFESDNCSGRILTPGASCEIIVSHTPIRPEDDKAGNFGLLKIPNSDPLAPELAVSLFGEA